MDTESDVLRNLVDSETSYQEGIHPFLLNVRRASASKTA